MTKNVNASLKRSFDAYLYAKNYDKAVQMGEEYLKVQSDDKAIIQNMAQVYGLKKENLVRAEQLIAKLDKNTQNKYIRKIASNQKKKKNWDVAITWYQKAQAIRSTSSNTKKIAICFEEKGDWTNAIKNYIKFMDEKGPGADCSNVALKLGKYYEDKGSTSRAISYYRKSIEGTQFKNNIAKKLMIMYYEASNYDSTLEMANLLKKKGKEDNDVIIYKARSMRQLGNNAEAKTEYQRLASNGKYKSEASQAIKSIDSE
ncbi:MAG: tetratricopeptide repeat protein [Candidatus Cloacimonetes bacterium]|nr:tetratricopeptide repeat protein [Candidatus Cloacimonadota bacterium]